MAINTDTITSNGTESFFEYAGGAGAAIASGTFDGGLLELEFSLDNTNYAPIGNESILFQPNGFAIANIPACRMRWKMSNGGDNISITASVENA